MSGRESLVKLQPRQNLHVFESQCSCGIGGGSFSCETKKRSVLFPLVLTQGE